MGRQGTYGGRGYLLARRRFADATSLAWGSSSEVVTRHLPPYRAAAAPDLESIAEYRIASSTTTVHTPLTPLSSRGESGSGHVDEWEFSRGGPEGLWRWGGGGGGLMGEMRSKSVGEGSG